MTELVTVTSADDPRLTDFTALTDVALRRVREPAEGLFLAEGEKVISRALRAGYRPRAVLTERRWLDALADDLAATTARCSSPTRTCSGTSRATECTGARSRPCSDGHC